MSQEDVVEFLKRRKGEKFTADELQKFLNLGPGLYENLKRLRPKCRWCGGAVFGAPENCPWCFEQIVWDEGVRCVKALPKGDSRGHVFMYWFEVGE